MIDAYWVADISSTIIKNLVKARQEAQYELAATLWPDTDLPYLSRQEMKDMGLVRSVLSEEEILEQVALFKIALPDIDWTDAGNVADALFTYKSIVVNALNQEGDQ